MNKWSETFDEHNYSTFNFTIGVCLDLGSCQFGLYECNLFYGLHFVTQGFSTGFPRHTCVSSNIFLVCLKILKCHREYAKTAIFSSFFSNKACRKVKKVENHCSNTYPSRFSGARVTNWRELLLLHFRRRNFLVPEKKLPKWWFTQMMDDFSKYYFLKY